MDEFEEPLVDPVDYRFEVFSRAMALVNPVVAEYGLEAYMSGNPIQGWVSTNTPAEQYVDLVLRVAEWLLRMEN